jgi:hypothetical protein
MSAYASYKSGDRFHLKPLGKVIEVKEVFVESGQTKVKVEEYDYSPASGGDISVDTRTITNNIMSEYISYERTNRLPS